MPIKKISRFKELDVFRQKHVDFFAKVLEVKLRDSDSVPLDSNTHAKKGMVLTYGSAQKLNSLIDLRTSALSVAGNIGPGPCPGCLNCTEWQDGSGDTWHQC